MRTSVLSFLCCPICGGPFALTEQERQQDHVVTGGLTCAKCVKTYPIRDGIPRLVPETIAPVNAEIARRFGYEWKRFARFYDLYKDQFLDWIQPVQSSFFSEKVILDAGCGKGRHLRLAADFGARVAIGVDVSDAVEVAFAATRDMPNAHVIQGDLFHLPLTQSFEYAYSIGVLDHTPNPRGAFESVVGRLLPGGSVSVWVYGKEGNGWITGIMDPLRKIVFSRAPLWFVKAMSFTLGVILVGGLRTVYRPLRGSWLGKHLPYAAYLTSIADFPFEEVTSIIFDHLVPPEAHYLPEQEIRNWFVNGFRDVVVSRRNNNSWRGYGVRL